jgi:gliding motility-associated-like protein
VHPKPPISAGTDKTICRDSGVQLKASGGVRYVWMPNDTTLVGDTLYNPYVHPKVNTTYSVTGTDVYGCVNSGTVRVFVIQPVVPHVYPEDTTVCYNHPFLERASGGNFYKWVPVAGLSNPFDSSTLITLKKDATYTVTISNQCFSATAVVTIHVQPLPSVVVTPHTSYITTGGEVVLKATGSGPGVYSWLPNSGILGKHDSSVVTVQPQVNTTYTVTFGSGPCMVTDSAIVTLKCANLRMPNIFTPDQAQNNIFRPVGVAITELLSFRVYDRWGALVYSSTDKTSGWDGTRKGGKCEQGVYVYYIEAVCTDGEIIRTQGNITLLR